jgi:hypothetical protein
MPAAVKGRLNRVRAERGEHGCVELDFSVKSVFPGLVRRFPLRRRRAGLGSWRRSGARARRARRGLRAGDRRGARKSVFLLAHFANQEDGDYRQHDDNAYAERMLASRHTLRISLRLGCIPCNENRAHRIKKLPDRRLRGGILMRSIKIEPQNRKGTEQSSFRLLKPEIDEIFSIPNGPKRRTVRIRQLG